MNGENRQEVEKKRINRNKADVSKMDDKVQLFGPSVCRVSLYPDVSVLKGNAPADPPDSETLAALYNRSRLDLI